MTDKRNDIDKMAAEQHLRLLINHTDDPIWLVDPNFIILECNKSFKKWVTHFIGKELNEGDHVLDNGCHQLYHDKFVMCYQLALMGRTFKAVEDMKVGEETRYTNVSFNPVFDEEHKVIGVSCFARDITEQRKHLMRIEEQNTALREIAFIESHKVRGPVATIMGLEQFFNYDDLTDPMNKEIMQSISKMIHDLDDIIREVVRKSNEIGAR